MDSIRTIRPPTLQQANDRLRAIETTARARGDEATLSVVACTRAIEQAFPDSPEAKLNVLQETVRALEAAPASTVGMQASIAQGVLNSVQEWPTLAAMNDGARRAVVSLADSAAATHAPEARNARFLADIANVVEGPESVLARMSELEAGDVDRLSWYVSAAQSGALPGIMTVGQRARGARVTAMGLDEIRRNGGNPHLARMEDWQGRLRSPMSRLMARYHTLEMIDNGVPAGPEAGLVLAHKICNWAKLPAEDKAAARQAAVDEALPTATGDLRAWLDFHQAARGIPHAEKMLDVLLYCVVLWGSSPEPASLDFALYEALRANAPEPQMRDTMWKAFDTLTGTDGGWRDSVERYVELADRCEKAAPQWEVPMLERALQGARTTTDPSARVLLEVLDQAPAGGDRKAQLRQGLSQLLRVGEDRMQDALTRPTAEPGGITTADDYVMIGGLRVPRRALS